MSKEPRAKTAEEIKDGFMGTLWALIDYWSKQEGTAREQIAGFAHSVLSVMDGVSVRFPASLKLVVSVHPADKEYYQEMGKNWYEDETVIAEWMLHEEFYDHDPRRGDD